MCALLDFGEDFESAASACAAIFVRGVGDFLNFSEDEVRDNQLGFDDLCFDDIGDASINQGAAVDDERATAFQVALEFDVGDDEAEVIFGLQQQ